MWVHCEYTIEALEPDYLGIGGFIEEDRRMVEEWNKTRFELI